MIRTMLNHEYGIPMSRQEMMPATTAVITCRAALAQATPVAPNLSAVNTLIVISTAAEPYTITGISHVACDRKSPDRAGSRPSSPGSRSQGSEGAAVPDGKKQG